MGDKDVRQTKAVFQFPQQIHDLYLRVRIQRGDRFIKQNDLRLAGHRAGDADTLQLSAGKLMGKPVSKIGRQTDQLQQTARFCFPIQFFALSAFLYGQPFPNNIPNAEPGICGGCVILKHDAEFILQISPSGTGSVDRNAIQNGFTAVWLEQPAEHTAHRGFAGAAFPQNAQTGALFYGK